MAETNYPALVPPSDTSAYGKHIQRTMTLLESSSPSNRPTVRILHYGQSITTPKWTSLADQGLRERYPYVDFEIKNLGLGGFGSPLLVRTMHYDLLPFYPDLVVFHVFGDHRRYEEIIRTIRANTTAEVIMQTDHANKWPEPKTEGNFWTEQAQWGDTMNYFILPAIAERYGCALQPQRWEWVDYLKAHTLEPEALLSDSVHLNPHGCWLMSELLQRFMVYLPDEPPDEWQELVTTYTIGDDVQWDGKKLELEFDGNRVVALAAPGGNGAADVYIDGRPPSSFAECYTFTRPSGTPHIGWPAIKKITARTPLLLEEWKAVCTGFNDAQDEFTFTVSGSLTGPDGEGNSQETFVSKSGRVVIEPDDWVYAYDRKVSKKTAPETHEVTWDVKPLFVDTYEPPVVDDPAREYQAILVQGLENGPHTLTLVARGETLPSIKALRVYRPPLDLEEVKPLY